VSEDHWGFWRARADMLEALAQDALGDPDAADAALERALDLSERSGDMTPFLLYPASGLLERHTRHRTAHAALVADIRGLLAGTGGYGGTGSSRVRRGGPGIVPPRLTAPLLEPLSRSEVRVLRYLPTNLTAPEIAREPSVSTNTVKSQIRSVYAKLGTHYRADAVESARTLGLPAPASARARPASPARP
jgi:LuxR family transcriptional regulator, maltose regulon positive regulatory protein